MDATRDIKGTYHGTKDCKRASGAKAGTKHGQGRNNSGYGGDSTKSYLAYLVQPVGDHNVEGNHNPDHTIKLLLPTGDEPSTTLSHMPGRYRVSILLLGHQLRSAPEAVQATDRCGGRPHRCAYVPTDSLPRKETWGAETRFGYAPPAQLPGSTRTAPRNDAPTHLRDS